MSLQEAASSGSFNPRAAQPTDPQPADGPFDALGVDAAVDQAAVDAATPFGGTYDYSPSADEAIGGGSEPDMRATRRRAWTVVGLAIVIPAAVAGVIAWQLFGADTEPAPTVTRVTTTPAEPVAQQVPATSSTLAASAAATPATDTTTVAAATASTAATTTASVATDAEATEAAAVAAEAEVDLASLDPAARLAAWTNLETIQVLPGETLWLIAQNYGTTISAIATLNGIADPQTLSIGQQLVIPVGFAEDIVETAPAVATESGSTADAGGSPAITATATAGVSLAVPDDLANWHTIAPVQIEEGDSLEAIAVANNTSVGAIMALNGISDPNLIFVGVDLLVPVGYQGDIAVPDVAAPQVQQASTDTSTGDAGTATTTTEEQTTATDDLMEEENTGAGTGDNDDMMEE